MSWFNLLKANARKEYIELKRYLPNTLAEMFTFYFIFLGMFFGIQVVGDPGSQDLNTQYVIVNYIFWFLSLIVMSGVGWEVTNEALRGTLEQLCMSPKGTWLILLMRLISTTVIFIVIIAVLLVLSMATAGQWLNIDILTLLPIVILTIIGMFGIGFIIAGISITLKQVQAFLNILQFIFAGLTFIPLSVAPYLAYAPLVKGVDMVRQVMIYNATLSDLGLGIFLILTTNSIIYLVIGLFVFFRCERFARDKGLLAHY